MARRAGRAVLGWAAFLGAVVILVTGLGRSSDGNVVGTVAEAPVPTPVVWVAAPLPAPSPKPPRFDLTAFSIDDPTSPWVVVNKTRPIAVPGYVPPDLVSVPVAGGGEMRAEAAGAVAAMFAAFSAETGMQLQAQSTYRSFNTQISVYAGWVSSLGQAAADLTSARPGHSEHQLGLAIDVNSVPGSPCALEPCFGATPHAQWILANSWRFGLIVRYHDGQTLVTGYESEPYHLRYVGILLATEMHDQGIANLEDVFGLPPAPGY